MAEERTGRAAFLVGSGIFASRLAGLVRQRIFAHYLGASLANDAFQGAFRIPNLLQNLFGEGVLSASFIPEYAGTLARGETRDAQKLAGAVFGALALVASVIVLLGVLAAPQLVGILAGGGSTLGSVVRPFAGILPASFVHWITSTGATPAEDALTTTLVRILFPGAGLLVFSAWCLGVLNANRRFLVSYMAPLAWNAVMIIALLVYGPRRGADGLVIAVAWASVVGSAAQFLVQIPSVRSVAPGIVPNFHFGMPAARRVFKQFSSAFLSRGVVQISAFVDLALAYHLPIGTVSSLAYAQNLYLLPGSLFGMSVSAAELPAMSSALGTSEEIAAQLRARLNAGMERIAFFIVPCVIGFIVLGDIVTGAFLQTGAFKRGNTVWVWEILIGSTVGLLASTLGRLDASTYYALRDTRTPLKFALVRIALTTVLGVIFAFQLPGWLGLDPKLGAAGLTASAGIAGWVEFILLRRGLTKRIGRTGLKARYVGLLWVAGLGSALVASGGRLLVPTSRPLLLAAVSLTAFGAAYLALAAGLRVPEATALVSKLRRRPGV
ncbi:MAG: murein biosynthesis integral membrane protein MurJ [Gemmatimonadota bacterium]|nr:murein biosynthesis integral membrane protein MurJ [Gemmatimonadota bacterium]